MATRKLVVELVGDDKSLSRTLGRSEKKITKFGAAAKTAGLGLATGLGAGAVAAVKEAREAEKVGRQTAAVIKSTRGVANVTRREIESLSNAISLKAGVDDEAVQSGQNLLLTFKNIRNEAGASNTFKRTAQAAVDMSAAMNAAGKKMSISDAMLQLGKAVNDPEKGMTRLMRTGVDFTQKQKDQVKALVASGKTMQAQGVILKEVEAQFGGSAKANADGLDRLKVAGQNLLEVIGGPLLTALNSAANSVASFLTKLQSGKGAGDFANSIRKNFEQLKSSMNISSADIKRAVQAITNVFNAAKATAQRVWPGIKQVIQGQLGIIIGVFKVFSGVLTGDFGAAWRGLKQIVSGALRTVVGLVRAMSVPFRAAFAKMGEAVKGPLGGAFNFLKGAVRGATVFVLRHLSRILGGFSSMLSAGAKIPGIGGAFRKAATGIDAARRKLDGTADALEGIKKNRNIDVKVNVGLRMGEAVGGPLGDLLAGRPFDRPRARRKGGRVNFAEGGTVPVRLSPGEMGIEPGGRSFMVPGRPVAADSVGAMVRPGTKILTGSGQAMLGMGASVSQALMHQAPHFAHGGKVHAGKYNSTSYGPPWNAMNGTGVTKTGVNLKAAPKVYGVAVDPRVIPLGSSLSIDPNPFNTRKPFRAFDTGGAIKGNRIDFYDWRGRSKQLGWGRRSVSVTKAGSGGRGRGGSQAPRRGSVSIPAGITNPLLGNIMSPLVDDALLGGIEAGRNRTGRTALLTSVLEGIAPESGDYATRRRFEVAAASPGRRGSAGGGRGGSKAFRRAVTAANTIDRKGYPYSTPGNRTAKLTGGPMDCSGAVSKVLMFAGLMNGPVQASPYFKDTYGKPGGGKQITTYSKGGYGASGHVFMSIGGRDFGTSGANPGGGAGWFNAGAGYKSQFVKRHPPGFRKGGVVGADAMARLPKKWQTPQMMAEIQRHGIMPGYRKGTRRGGVRRVARRQPRIGRLIRGLAGNPGNRGAQSLTQSLSKRVGGRSMGALLRARTDIRKRIRIMSRGGLTGPERIQVRRLRGALTLIEDEMGRPIGRALGSSDEHQDTISRSMGNLDNELTVAGIDPESAAGVARKVGRTSSALGALSGRRAALGSALTRARASGNRAAVDQVQTEINEVDDQILGLRADLKTLSKATTEASTVMADAQRELAESNKALAASIDAQNAVFNSATAVTARQLQGALTDMVSGTLGGRIGQRAQTAGTGQLARY